MINAAFWILLGLAQVGFFTQTPWLMIGAAIAFVPVLVLKVSA